MDFVSVKFRDTILNMDVKTFQQFNEMQVTRRGGYLAFVLTHSSREELLRKFPPKYEKVICEHVTWKFPAEVGDEIPSVPKDAHVIGYQDGGDIEALVVEINGSNKRPDGALLHVTLSLNPATKKPKHSNDLLAANGFNHVSPIAIHLEPKQIF